MSQNKYIIEQYTLISFAIQIIIVELQVLSICYLK
jgi:hypothetical protein